MGSYNGQHWIDELQRRITQLASDPALAAFNKAAEWITDQGSFTFDLLGNQTIISANAPAVDDPSANFSEILPPAAADLKKAVYLTNTNGMPIIKAPFNRLWESFGVNNPADQGFTTFLIVGDRILLRPPQSSGVGVGFRYHLKFVPIDKNTTTRLPDELDQLACDLAEAEERRIHSVGEQWIKMRDDIRSAITKMLDGYRSVSQEPMPLEEATQAIQESTKLGKA